MDYHDQHSQPKICSKHNQPIVVVNSDPKIGPSCVICVQNWPGNVSIEQFNQKQQAVYDKLYQELDLKHQVSQSLLDKLLKFKERVNSGLGKIIQLIMDQIKIIKDSKIKIGSIIQSDCNKDIVIKEFQQQQFINKNFIDQVGNQLKSFQSKFAEIGQQNKVLHQNLRVNAQNEENESLKKTKIKIKEVYMRTGEQFFKCSYDLVEELTVKLEKYSYSFSFNNDNTFLLVGCGKEIIVYKFLNAKTSIEYQKLNNHTKDVNCLQFMIKSNSFVSGSDDNTIIFWVLDQNKKWITHQILKEHTDFVSFILMNKMEDQLISGSFDSTLKFWKLIVGCWICWQTIRTKYKVRNMSLNELEDKLIVCENNCNSNTQKSSIQVLIQNNKKEWFIAQTLDFDGWGWRLGFTIEDQFIFSIQNSDLLEIYDCSRLSQFFLKVAQLQIQKIKGCCASFPCKYIKTLNVLTFKHGNYLNIIKVNKGYQYQQIQKIKFDTQWIYGQMSDNGQYIATWDSSSKEVQIRKFQSLE